MGFVNVSSNENDILWKVSMKIYKLSTMIFLRRSFVESFPGFPGVLLDGFTSEFLL